MNGALSIGRSMTAGLTGFVAEVGAIALLGVQALALAVRPPYRLAVLVEQMRFIGVGSIFIVGLTGLFTGAVFSLQSVDAFRIFGAESMVGSTVALSLAREIAPVFTALMVTARAGSAMATELGTMRVSEQIDALETMAINPVQYLVAPRVIAAALVTPVLAMLFNLIGLAGAYFVAVTLHELSPHTFLHRISVWVTRTDVLGGLFKASVFGTLIALIACHKGFRAQGGSQGVGIATTEAVVMGAVTILVTDYALTSTLLYFFPAQR